jgi:hypothetical protein
MILSLAICAAALLLKARNFGYFSRTSSKFIGHVSELGLPRRDTSQHGPAPRRVWWGNASHRRQAVSTYTDVQAHKEETATRVTSSSRSSSFNPPGGVLYSAHSSPTATNSAGVTRTNVGGAYVKTGDRRARPPKLPA